MSERDADTVRDRPVGALRDLVVELLSEVRSLRDENAGLKTELASAKAENRDLKDEIAALKGLPPRPKFKTSKPSGMEKATGPSRGKGKRRRRGGKRDGNQVSREVVVPAEVPAGSRFKGYETILVRDLVLVTEVVRYRRERWVTPAGGRVVAPLPPGIVGGWGANLRRFILACHVQGQVTTERLTALLTGIGIAISKRQVVRLIADHVDEFVSEDRDVLRAGLATAQWVTVDDTSARHAHADGYTTQIGDDRFTAFRTGASKSRAAFLDTLRAGHGEHVVNKEALAYMRGRNLAGPVIDRLEAAPQKIFADGAAWQAHLTALGIDQLGVTPDPVRIRHRRCVVGRHPSPRPAGRHGDRLRWRRPVPRRRARAVLGACGEARPQAGAGNAAAATVGRAGASADLVVLSRPEGLAEGSVQEMRCGPARPIRPRIFRPRTGYNLLDRLLARLHRRKPELLRVLERPEIPLHTNGSENDIRAFVTKRKISGGTMSDAGRQARDVFLGLMKT